MDRKYTPKTLRYYDQELTRLYRDMLCVDGVPENTRFFALAMTSIELARQYVCLALELVPPTPTKRKISNGRTKTT